MIALADRRPQTIGELLDGAVRIYLHAFRPITIALGVVAVAMYVEGFINGAAPHHSLFADVADGFNHPTMPSAKAVSSALLSPALFMALIVPTVGDVLTMTVGFACIAAIDEQHGMLDLRAVFRHGVARLWPALAATLLQLMLSIALGGSAAVAAIVAITLTRRFVPLLSVVPMAVALLALFAFFVLGQLAWYQSMQSVTLDGRGAFGGLAKGLQLTFSRPYFKRAFLVGLVVLVTDFAEILVGDGIGDLVDLIPHAAVLGGLPTTLLAVPVQAIQIIFVFLYARDMRRRVAPAAGTPAMVPA